MLQTAVLGLLLSGAIIRTENVFAQEAAAVTPITVGQEVNLYSKVLDEDRTLLIHLPDSYQTNVKKDYPVLYTLDGTTHFKHMSGTVDWLSNQAARAPEMIVVAITNTQRGRDMTASHNSGGADNFIKFIEKDVFSYVDNHYRTRDFRILAGHSMAGHLTLNVLEQKPNMFNAYVAMSPWFHQDRGKQSLVRMLKKKLGKQTYASKFVFVSIGDEERLKPKYDEFVSVLEDNAHHGLDWRSKVSLEDDHMSIPSNTMNEALTFIFASQRLSPESDVAKQGIPAIKRYYAKLSNEIYGYDIPAESAINRLGFHLLRNQQEEKAIKVFKQNIKEFPDSANVHNSLAEAYRRTQKYNLALIQINKAINIGEKVASPNTEWYKRRKQRIEDAMKQSD